MHLCICSDDLRHCIDIVTTSIGIFEGLVQGFADFHRILEQRTVFADLNREVRDKVHFGEIVICPGSEEVVHQFLGFQLQLLRYFSALG